MNTRLFAALLAVLAIACTACSAAADSMAMNTGGMKEYDYGYATDSMVSAEVESSMQLSTAPSAPNKAEAGESGSASDPLSQRKIIRTMRIIAETKTFDAATAAIEQLCTDLGGYIESSSRSGGSIRYSS